MVARGRRYRKPALFRLSKKFTCGFLFSSALSIYLAIFLLGRCGCFEQPIPIQRVGTMVLR